jgi:hypothetical protein
MSHREERVVVRLTRRVGEKMQITISRLDDATRAKVVSDRVALDVGLGASVKVRSLLGFRDKTRSCSKRGQACAASHPCVPSHVWSQNCEITWLPHLPGIAVVCWRYSRSALNSI